jgi:hypothetical protein
MRKLLPLFWFIAIAGICTGVILNIPKVIGSGVVFLFFVVFPLFSYHRWKNKKVSDYLLTKDNLDKMKAFNDAKH